MARQPGFIRDEILMLLGLCLLGFGGLALLGFILDEDPFSSKDVGGLILVGMMLVGGFALFMVGLSFRRLEQRLRRVLTVLHSTDRCTIRSLAQNASVTDEQARQAVIFLVSRGFIGRRFDPKQDLVFSPNSVEGQGGWLKLPGNCPHCHAPTPTMIPMGPDVPRCEYCSTLLPTELLDPGAAQRVDQRMASQPPVAAMGSNAFTGSWGLLIVLFVVFWPGAIVYLMQNLKRHGGSQVLYPPFPR